MEKYINPFTDYGFKRIFGEEANKDLLMDFLNELLREEQGEITDLQFLKSEQLGNTNLDRKAIFDLYCTNSKGERFIVELQKTKQKYFKDRSLYYATFPIQEQAERGDWSFKLNPVYTIAILDFVFDEDKDDKDKYRYDIKLKDIKTNKIFYDKFTFIYLEMPKFNKTEDELESRYDKWLYVLKNLHKFERIPDKLKEKIFKKLFDTAEIAAFSSDELQQYNDSVKYYRDIKNSLDTAREEGRLEGREEGREKGREEGRHEGLIETALNMLKMDFSVEQVALATGLSVEEIKQLSI